MVINQLLKICTFHFHHQVWYIESDFPQRNRFIKASRSLSSQEGQAGQVCCRGMLQSAAPVGVFVALEPWDVNDKMEKPPTSVLWISWDQILLMVQKSGELTHLWDV